MAGEVTLNSIKILIEKDAERGEERHDATMGRLDKINGTLKNHEGRIVEGEKTDAVMKAEKKEHKRTLKWVGGIILGLATLLGTLITIVNIVK